MILYVPKNGLEGAEKERDIGSVYLPRLWERRMEVWTLYAGKYNCSVYKPVLPRDRGSVQEETKLLSNLFVWFWMPA